MGQADSDPVHKFVRRHCPELYDEHGDLIRANLAPRVHGPECSCLAGPGPFAQKAA